MNEDELAHWRRLQRPGYRATAIKVYDVAESPAPRDDKRRKEEKMKDKPWQVLVAAIIGLVIIEVYALHQGINGVMMSLVVAGISGIAGFTIPNILKK